VGIAGQVGDTGTYAAGGGALVTALVSVNGTTAFVDFDDLSFTGVTLTARGALIYNDTQAGDPSVCVLDFGGDKTATAGTFTIQFPDANDTQAIIRIS
jgi:hypothetical protein